MKKPIKICFIGLYSYSLFNKQTSYTFGGAEVRSYIISTELAKNPEYEVSYIVKDHGQKVEHLDNVKVYPHSMIKDYKAETTPQWFQDYMEDIIETGHVERLRQFPFVRFNKKSLKIFIKLMMILVYQYIRRLVWWYKQSKEKSIYIDSYKILYDHFKIYEKVDADVYCTFTVSTLAAEIGAYCQENNKKFILFTGSDLDFSEDYQTDSKRHNIYGSSNNLCHYAIKASDEMIVQTDYHAKLAKQRFDKSAIVVRNPINLNNANKSIPYSERDTVLWIGKSDKNKQPELFIQLAQQYPHLKFVMVMTPFNIQISQQIYTLKPYNVEIYDSVPFEEIEAFFAKAFAFVSTSGFEGFPNTFLQAGKYSVPILSLNVDPDGFIEKYNCGIIAYGDFDKLVSGLAFIEADLDQQIYSKNIRDYVYKNHNLIDRIQQIQDVINQLEAKI